MAGTGKAMQFDRSNMTITAGDATPGEVAAFHQMQSPPPPNELQAVTENIMGDQNRFMDSARYDLEPRGITSDQHVPPAQWEEQTPQEQPAYLEQPAAPEAEPNFKQKYGDALNQMGEWRRQAQQAQSDVEALRNQMAELSARVTMGQNASSAAGNYGAPYGMPAPPQQQLQPLDFLPGRPDDYTPTKAELNESLNRFTYGDVLPAIRQAQQIAYQQAVNDVQRRATTWDISPVEEQNIRARFPSIGAMSLPDQNQFILEHAHALRQNAATVAQQQPYRVAPAGGTQAPQPTRPVVVDPRSVIRKQTYVESAAPASTQPEPTVSLTPQQALQRDLDALDAAWQAKGHERAPATEMKKVLEAHGIKEVNDFGGQVLTR